MRSSKSIHIISAHAEGEVGEVILGGVAPPPGETLWAQSRFIAKDKTLRNFVLNEPRGGVFKHVNLLVPPKHPDADAAFIIMEPEDTPPMSGSNSMCVATVLLETGLVEMKEPETKFTIEAPGGLVHARADCKNGKASRVYIQNVPSFAVAQNVPLTLEELGIFNVDLAYGGDSFVIVDIDKIGEKITPENAHKLAKLGTKITNAANEQIGFKTIAKPEWSHISFCLFAGALKKNEHGFEAAAAVAIQPGKIDRSPTGTALSARMALLHAKGEMKVGDRLTTTSIIGSKFQGQILSECALNGVPAINTELSGRAWISGSHQLYLDPEDPWPQGYRLSDTWGAK